MVKSLRITAITLLLINGIGALWGGFGLIYDPSGAFMQMPLDFLQYSPFTNYLIPGVILLVFNGLLSLIASFFAIKNHRIHPYFTIFQGMVLTIWLTVQIILIKVFYFPLHFPFYTIGLTLVFIGLFQLKGVKQEFKFLRNDWHN